MKNDAQAMKITQTGTVTTVAVSSVATPPSTPMLILSASFDFIARISLSTSIVKCSLFVESPQ
jgi:hypothetical protein